MPPVPAPSGGQTISDTPPIVANGTAPTATSGASILSSSGSLPANVSQSLQGVYQQYLQYASTNESESFKPTGVGLVEVNGTSVGVQINGNGMSDFNTLLSQLQGEGFQVTSSNATDKSAQGMLPIAQLPDAAQLSGTLSITAMYAPMFG